MKMIDECKSTEKAQQNSLALEHLVYSEEALLEVLDVDKETLDTLRRDKSFPYVRLTSRHRVYLADDVLAWLNKQAAR